MTLRLTQSIFEVDEDKW